MDKRSRSCERIPQTLRSYERISNVNLCIFCVKLGLDKYIPTNMLIGLSQNIYYLPLRSSALDKCYVMYIDNHLYIKYVNGCKITNHFNSKKLFVNQVYERKMIYILFKNEMLYNFYIENII